MLVDVVSSKLRKGRVTDVFVDPKTRENIQESVVIPFAQVRAITGTRNLKKTKQTNKEQVSKDLLVPVVAK